MTDFSRSLADKIIDMSRDILQMQFPALRIVSEKDHLSEGCIVHDVNAGGDPYVGVYVGNQYFVVLVDRSCQQRMKNGDAWIARVLTLTSWDASSGENDLSECEEHCRTPAELMAKIAARLDTFKPYETPYVVYMSADCMRILSMPEPEWEADSENGQCPGNFLAVVAGDSTDDAILRYTQLHPRTDRFLEMCGLDASPGIAP